MRELIYAAALVVAVAAQVAVAPLFRLGGAEANIVLVFLLFVLFAEGPRPAMVAMPAAAVLLSFAAGRSVAVVILAFLPLIPVAAWLEETRVPVGRFPLIVVALLVSGAWLRSVLAAGAVMRGADPAFWTLAWWVLVPGALLDLTLLGFAYLPYRLVGLEPRAMSLAASRY